MAAAGGAEMLVSAVFVVADCAKSGADDTHNRRVADTARRDWNITEVSPWSLLSKEASG
jgi:hypothetical protein